MRVRLLAILCAVVWLPPLTPRSTTAQTWIDDLPAGIRSHILWRGDHETGTMDDWTMSSFEFPGGGIFNTGGDDVAAEASAIVAHSGNWSARTEITDAIRAQNGGRAVRLMRWTDRAWDNGGGFFPDAAYYSTWAYFPHVYNPNKYQPWDPGDGGWWNIFQFKGPDENDESQPLWALNVDHDDTTDTMSLYLYSNFNHAGFYGQDDPKELPVGEWVHLEAYYESATGENGQIKIWQDGTLILEASDVVTSLGGTSGDDTHPVWGIGNYTDHIDGDPEGIGTATIFFDDALVSTIRANPLIDGDFNDDGLYDCADVDLLVVLIAANENASSYDLTGDGFVDLNDLDAWLAEAGATNLPSAAAYLPGDANLDGLVDGLDFIQWNNNKFTATAAWCRGDFDANSVIDGLDFIQWNNNKFTSADHIASVPEPSASSIGILLVAALAGLRGQRLRR